MKILAIGDIHGRTIVLDIIKRYITEVDKIVLIGDYFDSFDVLIDEQIRTFTTLLDFKRSFPDQIVLLIGNHDCHYLNFWQEQYSGFQRGHQYLIGNLLNENLHLMQMAFNVDDILLTHAGVSKTWCKRILGNENLQCNEFTQNAINDQWHHMPFKSFGFCGRNYYGDDVTQGPVWIRPNSLIDDAIPGIQIVGHTQQPNGISKSKTKDGKVYFIDCLNYSTQCLLIDTDVDSDYQYQAISF